MVGEKPPLHSSTACKSLIRRSKKSNPPVFDSHVNSAPLKQSCFPSIQSPNEMQYFAIARVPTFAVRFANPRRFSFALLELRLQGMCSGENQCTIRVVGGCAHNHRAGSGSSAG
jgi:hypothetical protein